MTNFKLLYLRQLDDRLSQFKGFHAPPGGWIRLIRDALGMGAGELAQRLGISRQSIAALERREQTGKATVRALSRAADALDCEFVYGFVPRSGLKRAIEQQARRRAEEEIARTAHTMRLEAQGVSQRETEHLIEERTRQLMARKRGLWAPLDADKITTGEKGKRRGPAKR